MNQEEGPSFGPSSKTRLIPESHEENLLVWEKQYGCDEKSHTTEDKKIRF
jgi:hypothetical protein